jgi:hypothetical protein
LGQEQLTREWRNRSGGKHVPVIYFSRHWTQILLIFFIPYISDKYILNTDIYRYLTRILSPSKLVVKQQHQKQMNFIKSDDKNMG